MNCVLQDPRTDRQVESREEFYGELAVALDLAITPLVDHLFSPDDALYEDEYRTGLTTGVLANMARRGRTDAIPVLRDYVARGFSWRGAAYDLSTIGPAAYDGLGNAVAARLDDQAIVDTAHYSGPMWDRWRAENARLAVANVKKDRARRSRDDEQASTEKLLEAKNGVAVLRHRVADADLLRRTVRDGRATVAARVNSLVALGYMRDRSMIEDAEVALGDSSERISSGAWRYFMQILRDGPVPTMRRWTDRVGTPHRRLAAHMLADWGSSDDAPLMRAMLPDFISREEGFNAMCDLIEGLARVGDARDLPMLRTTYEETDYSWLRVRAARGLARLSPTFPIDLAVECLWDCEDETRELGCGSASLAVPAARRRVEALSASDVEEPKVRQAALAALA